MELEQLLTERNASKQLQAQQQQTESALNAEQDRSTQKVVIPPLLPQTERVEDTPPQLEKVRASQEFKRVSSRPPAIDTTTSSSSSSFDKELVVSHNSQSNALTVIVDSIHTTPTHGNNKRVRPRSMDSLALNSQVALTSEGVLTCTSDVTGGSPCQCKYCQPDNYSYQTLYDRNGHYIGPPELKAHSSSNSLNGSSVKATNANKDVYLHSYFSPSEVNQMAQKRQGSRPTSAGSASGHRSASKAPLTEDEKQDMSVFGSTAPARKVISHIPRYHREQDDKTRDGLDDFISALQTVPTFTSPLPKRLSSPSPTKRTSNRLSTSNVHTDEEVAEHRRHSVIDIRVPSEPHFGSKPYIGCRLCSRKSHSESAAVSELTTNASQDTERHSTPTKSGASEFIHSVDKTRHSFPVNTSHRNVTSNTNIKNKKSVLDGLDLAINSLEAHRLQQEEQAEADRQKGLVTQSARKYRSSKDMLNDLTQEGMRNDLSSGGNILRTSPVLSRGEGGGSQFGEFYLTFNF
jgi:hypothetical protein